MIRVLASIVVASLFTGVSAVCPSSDWLDAGNGQCYAVFIQSPSFSDALEAQKLCHVNGSELASIPDFDTESRVLELLRNTTSNMPIYHAYIGLTDVNASDFLWLDGSAASYSNLSAEEASRHFIPGDSRCTVLSSGDGQWDGSRDNVTWSVVPCCFREYSVNAVVCSAPSTSTDNSTSTALQDYCYGSCPEGWHKWQTECFGVWNHTSNMTMYARDFCQSRGADLPTVADAGVDGLLDYVFKRTSQIMNESTLAVYIGLNDIAAKHSRVHLDQSPINYTNWATGEPSNDTTPDNKTADCTKMSWSSAGASWSTVSCCTDENIAWTACQKPESGSAPSVQPDDNVFAQKCVEEIDDCVTNPCGSNGTCVELLVGYSCNCSTGYTGNHCETEIDYCTPDPCLNSGSCTSYPGAGYVCTCTTGYNGTNCETPTDPCLISPCQNNGTCVAGSGNFTCSCLPGTTGTLCETNFDDCSPSSCQNGGTCVDHVGYYTCSCAAGFTGTSCSDSVSCPLPGTVANATLNSTTGTPGTFDSTMTFGCYSGHKFPDMTSVKTIKCTMASGWNDTVTACDAHCDELPYVPNAFVHNGNTLVGNTVNFTCGVGFVMSDNSTSVDTTCLSNRTWNNDLSNVSCQRVLCPPVPDWPHQTVDTTNNTYNTTVTFWCDVGYVLFDNTTARTIKCLADGSWSADLPPCNPVMCPEMNEPSGTTRNTSDNTYLTYAHYSCVGDTRMLDGSTYRTVLCDAAGEWSDTVTDCGADRCFPLPYVANATPSTTAAEYWTLSVLTCYKGHRFFVGGSEYDFMSMTCQTNGWWSPVLTYCQPILCPAVPTGNFITPSTDNQLFGTVVDYQCLPGHYVHPNTPVQYDSLSIECLESKVWNFTAIPDCTPIVCSPPPTIVNGSYTAPANFEYSALALYECFAGFKFIDGRNRKNLRCNEAGHWNETDVSCRSDRCNPVNVTAHATPDSTNTSWHSTVTYSCHPGYEWPSANSVHSITCLPGGTWNGSFGNEQDCKIKYCVDVEQLGNATANTTDHHYDTYVQYDCNIGFKYSDETTSKWRRCTENALWKPNPFPTCNIIYCPELMDVENATRDSNDTHYDKRIIYSCLPGYQFPDKQKQKVVHCTENETWTDFPPPCEVVFCPPLPYWSETLFNSTDNNFLSVVTYWCNDGYAFKGYTSKPGNETVLSSMCLASKTWYPAILDCHSLESINADLEGKTYDSPQAVPIGTVACSIMCLVLAAVVLLDSGKLYADFTMMKSNIRRLMGKRTNKVEPSP